MRNIAETFVELQNKCPTLMAHLGTSLTDDRVYELVVYVYESCDVEEEHYDELKQTEESLENARMQRDRAQRAHKSAEREVRMLRKQRDQLMAKLEETERRVRAEMEKPE